MPSLSKQEAAILEAARNYALQRANLANANRTYAITPDRARALAVRVSEDTAHSAGEVLKRTAETYGL